MNVYIKVTTKNLSVYFHYQQTLFCFIAIILGTETITIIFLKIYFCMRTSSVCRNSTPRWSKSLHRVKFMNVHFLPLSQNGYCINRLVYFFLVVLTNFSASIKIHIPKNNESKDISWIFFFKRTKLLIRITLIVILYFI